MSEENKMKVAKWIVYIALTVGVFRLIEYYFFGDLHRGYAFAWYIHALVTAPLALWFIRREEKKIKLARKE